MQLTVVATALIMETHFRFRTFLFPHVIDLLIDQRFLNYFNAIGIKINITQSA